VVREDETTMKEEDQLETLLDWAQQAGMDTGIITTARITHATPGALYAKTAERYWECTTEGHTNE